MCVPLVMKRAVQLALLVIGAVLSMATSRRPPVSPQPPQPVVVVEPEPLVEPVVIVEPEPAPPPPAVIVIEPAPPPPARRFAQPPP